MQYGSSIYIVNTGVSTALEAGIIGDRSRAHCIRRDSFPSFPTPKKIKGAYPDVSWADAEKIIDELALSWVGNPEPLLGELGNCPM